MLYCFNELKKIQVRKKNKYGNKSRLLFTDTDYLMFQNKTYNVIKILIRLKKCLILVIIQVS